MFDIIVIGAGHAGCEAAAAAAKLGSHVLLITMDMTKIGQMSCNPAMGGIGKGQLIREIDALGGLSGIISDKSAIQFKMLNRSKGPAMWSPRSQNDRMDFSKFWRRELEQIKNISFWQDSVNSLLIEQNVVKGVKTKLGITFKARAVILTSGTFLNGIIHVGGTHFSGGRIGEPPSGGLTEQLKTHGIKSGRMKTGTPPRLDGRTIDFTQTIPQPGDEKPEKFSFWDETYPVENQLNCFLTYTNEKVHKILEKGFPESPIFTGKIKGIGPRYCPSIEDKIVRFSDKKEHQLFLEPEGRQTIEFYLNGFSTSLPWKIQEEALKYIPGLQKAKIFRPGYAIEYDFFYPTQLYPSLESRVIENLFFAGQVNGTTGYEEAAAQGLMAGINAHLKITNQEPLVLKRNEAYIGVLIDDLVYKGTEEPYRIFTSRAEYRITLRQNNADERLSPIGHKIGLLENHKYQEFQKKYSAIKELLKTLKSWSINPEEINTLLLSKGTSEITQKVKLPNILSRPQITLEDILKVIPSLKETTEKISHNRKDIKEAVEIYIKYEGYLERENQMAEKLSRIESIPIPPNIDFESIKPISTEGRQKLSKYRPKTVGEASKISGVSPADISALLIHLGR